MHRMYLEVEKAYAPYSQKELNWKKWNGRTCTMLSAKIYDFHSYLPSICTDIYCSSNPQFRERMFHLVGRNEIEQN